MGINVTATKLFAFALCAIFAGVAGSLYASYASYITPSTFIQTLQINFLLMIVLGGLGSSWGAVLGATLITVIFEYTRAYAQYQKIAFGIIMILIVLFLKRGIMGTIRYHRSQKLIHRQHNKSKEEEPRCS
jgi:branched-chain amino acid transport system permease protein